MRVLMTTSYEAGGKWLLSRIQLHRIKKLPIKTFYQDHLDKKTLPKSKNLMVQVKYGNAIKLKSFPNRWNKIINITRHPLDVLVNILLDAQIRGDKLSRIYNVTPNHPVIAAFISSKGFIDKIELSLSMNKMPSVFNFRYEDIASDPESFFYEICKILQIDECLYGQTYKHYPTNLVTAPEKDNFQRTTAGIWRRLITPEQAECLIRHLGFDLSSYGYESSLQYSLSREEADKNYFELLINEMSTSLSSFVNEYINQNQACNHPVAREIFLINENFKNISSTLKKGSR